MSKRKTQVEAEADARSVNAELLTTYLNSHEKCGYRCLAYSHEWEAVPMSVRNGHGCPKCCVQNRANANRKTQEQAEEEASLMGVELMAPYIDNTTKTPYRCLKCKYEWNPVPGYIQQRTGCPKCAGNLPKTQEQAEAEARLVNAELLAPYINNNTKCRYRCNECRYEWQATPSDVQQLKGCPKHKLKAQSEIFDFVKTLQPDFVWEPRKILHNGQRPDMYSTSLNLIVEYDGRQHFEPVRWARNMSQESADEVYQKQILNDKKFNAQCAVQGINLIRISCYDYQKDPEDIYAKLTESCHNLSII